MILDRQVRSLLPFPMRNLHEETARQGLLNVRVVVLVLEFS